MKFFSDDLIHVRCDIKLPYAHFFKLETPIRKERENSESSVITHKFCERL